MSYSILGDVHTHTFFSRHAYSTIAENVAAAHTAGLEIYGAADHFSCMLFPEQRLRNFQYFINMEVWPRVWDGVTVLRGCEADIVSLNGGLFGQDIPCAFNITDESDPSVWRDTLFSRVTRNLDYVVASVHNTAFAAGATVAQVTDMYTSALERDCVFILGHTGRSGLTYDLDTVLTCAKEKHKLIEINEHSLNSSTRYHSICREIAERCAELGVGVCVNSDAHIALDIGRFPVVESMLEEIHFPEELIVNRGREPFLRELAASGVCDLTGLLESEE